MSAAAEPRARLSRGGLRWALTARVCQHLTVARIAEGLGVSWNTANSAVLAQGRPVLIADPHRFDGVRVIGVDEHVWRHTRRGDKYVTVIIDLTPVRDGAGPARLLDMVEGRSKQVFKTWLSERDETWRAAVDVVAMDGFTGFKTAAVEELKDDVTVVMDPFHVVRLAGHGLEQCRRRIQLQTCGHRGRTGDPLYSARRTPSTGADLLTHKQRQRIRALFAQDAHVEVEATWGVYQAMIGAYRDPDRTSGKDQDEATDPDRQRRRARSSRRNPHPRPDPEETGRRHPVLLRPAPAPATDPAKPSTAAWNTSADPPLASAT